MLQVVESENINLEKLRQLIDESSTTIFSHLEYFKPLSEHWCTIIDANYTKAIIVPYKKKLFWRWVYTPHFYRASEWIGDWDVKEQNRAIELLQNHFSFGQLNIVDVPVGDLAKKHQIIVPQVNFTDFYNKLALRMIAKAKKENLDFKQDIDTNHFVDFIQHELGKRIESFKSEKLQRFSAMLTELHKTGFLRYEGIVDGENLDAALVVIELPKRHLYLKGTSTESGKKRGLYYLLMHRAIERANKKNAIFDFGGSMVDGVARFNRNFGGTDVLYGALKWGKEPFSFRVIKVLINLWRKTKK
jgi:hypothetical protein